MRWREFSSRGIPAILLSLAATAAAAAATPLLEADVLSPRPGEISFAGGRLAIEWQAPDSEPFVEWEAFLSLDGGSSWPFRLTPHLGRDVRRFEAPLPPIPSSSARLLLRFGDEREERELELPFDFVIRPANLPTPQPLTLPAPSRGESARPGATGVVAWLEGPRHGAGSTLYTWHDAGWQGRGPRLVPGGERLLATEEGPAARPAALRASAAPGDSAPVHRNPLVSPPAVRGGSERLAFLGRRNE